jgi:hypothetical protein
MNCIQKFLFAAIFCISTVAVGMENSEQKPELSRYAMRKILSKIQNDVEKKLWLDSQEPGPQLSDYSMRQALRQSRQEEKKVSPKKLLQRKQHEALLEHIINTACTVVDKETKELKKEQNPIGGFSRYREFRNNIYPKLDTAVSPLIECIRPANGIDAFDRNTMLFYGLKLALDDFETFITQRFPLTIFDTPCSSLEEFQENYEQECQNLPLSLAYALKAHILKNQGEKYIPVIAEKAYTGAVEEGGKIIEKALNLTDCRSQTRKKIALGVTPLLYEILNNNYKHFQTPFLKFIKQEIPDLAGTVNEHLAQLGLKLFAKNRDLLAKDLADVRSKIIDEYRQKLEDPTQQFDTLKKLLTNSVNLIPVPNTNKKTEIKDYMSAQLWNCSTECADLFLTHICKDGANMVNKLANKQNPQDTEKLRRQLQNPYMAKTAQSIINKRTMRRKDLETHRQKNIPLYDQHIGVQIEVLGPRLEQICKLDSSTIDGKFFEDELLNEIFWAYKIKKLIANECTGTEQFTSKVETLLDNNIINDSVRSHIDVALQNKKDELMRLNKDKK